MNGKSKSPSGSQTVSAPQVDFNPKGYSIPEFGDFSYEGGKFVTKPSAAESKGITTRQSLINELLPEVGKTTDQRAGQINGYRDLFTKKILEQAMPLFDSEVYGKGLQGSSAQGTGMSELLNDAVERGLFAGEDLQARDETSKLQRGQFLEGGLQQAFQRLLGISQEGTSLNNLFFNNENANANRAFQASGANANIDATNKQAKLGAFGDLAGLGSLLAFAKLSGGGSSGGDGASLPGVGSNGQQALMSALSKISGGDYSNETKVSGSAGSKDSPAWWNYFLRPDKLFS